MPLGTGHLSPQGGIFMARKNNAIVTVNTTTELKTLCMKEKSTSLNILIDKDGKEWYAGADVIASCGITKARNAYLRVPASEKLVLKDAVDGRKIHVYLSLTGMFGLIMKSRTRKAAAFQQWVLSTVLPEIARSGGYVFGMETAAPGTQEKLRRVTGYWRKAIAREKAANEKLAAQRTAVKAALKRIDKACGRLEETDDLVFALQDKNAALEKEIEALKAKTSGKPSITAAVKKEEAKVSQMVIGPDGMIYSSREEFLAARAGE